MHLVGSDIGCRFRRGYSQTLLIHPLWTSNKSSTFRNSYSDVIRITEIFECNLRCPVYLEYRSGNEQSWSVVGGLDPALGCCSICRIPVFTDPVAEDENVEEIARFILEGIIEHVAGAEHMRGRGA